MSDGVFEAFMAYVSAGLATAPKITSAYAMVRPRREESSMTIGDYENLNMNRLRSYREGLDRRLNGAIG